MKIPDFRSQLQKDAESQLQAFGKRIRKNISQGQKDWKAGKLGNYGSINPFK